MCERSGAELAASDARQARIASLAARIGGTPCPKNVVELVKQRLELLRAEGMLPTAWDTMWARRRRI